MYIRQIRETKNDTAEILGLHLHHLFRTEKGGEDIYNII
jgi:hypothetical protein